MAGTYTPGMTVATAADLNVSNLVPVDTLNPSGQSPQTFAVPLGLLSTFTNYNTGVTAFAGGGQTSATQLEYGINNVTVVATDADSVKLPPCVAGQWVFVKNSDAAQSTTVYGYGTDTINSVATATGVALAATKGTLYFGVVGTGDGVAGNWVTLLGA